MFCAEMTMAEFALSMERPQSRQITRLKRTRPLHWSWLIEDRFFFEEKKAPLGKSSSWFASSHSVPLLPSLYPLSMASI